MTEEILVTTSYSLLKVNLRDHSLERVLCTEGLYYGIAHNASSIFVAARGRLASAETPAEAERGVIIELDRELHERRRFTAPFPLRDMHQIYWDRGRLLVTCSFDNLVAVFDGEEWTQWYPRGEPQTAVRDINHFNSIARFDAGLCILAHNKGASELVFFPDVGAPESSSISLGNQAHNIWQSGDEWMTCSSMDGRIIGTQGTSIHTGDFPRGICFHEEGAIVGISQIAERKDRDLSSGHLICYDGNWREQTRIHLPREGLVLDLLKL